MEIIVCIARVPDVAESEIEIGSDGRLIEDDLAYDINEWDNFAVEAALQLREQFDGNVLAVTVGNEVLAHCTEHPVPEDAVIWYIRKVMSIVPMSM